MTYRYQAINCHYLVRLHLESTSGKTGSFWSIFDISVSIFILQTSLPAATSRLQLNLYSNLLGMSDDIWMNICSIQLVSMDERAILRSWFAMCLQRLYHI